MQKLILNFVLIFSTVGINCENLEDIQILSQCDRTIATGMTTCMQYFSPIKFVTDFLKGDKESLCCTHFRHTACMSGVRDAVRMAKSANLCPDTFTDELVGTFTDSAVSNYIKKSCKLFNTGKCVMESVGDVVNTIQSFFVPQQQLQQQQDQQRQQKPILSQIFQTIPQFMQTVPQLFNSGNQFNTNNGNSYSNNGGYTPDDNYRNHNYNSDGTSLLNPLRDIINSRRIKPTTERPLINQSVRDLYDRQYIPEASDVKPVKEVADVNRTTENQNPLGSLLSGLMGTTAAKSEDSSEDSSDDYSEDNTEQPSIFDTIGSIVNTGINTFRNNQNKTNGQNFFANIFRVNGTDSADTFVKDITDSIN